MADLTERLQLAAGGRFFLDHRPADVLLAWGGSLVGTAMATMDESRAEIYIRKQLGRVC